MTVATFVRYHVPPSQVWGRSRGGARGNVHLHVAADVTVGRLQRLAGQCLCPKRHGSYERALDADEMDVLFRCETCASVASRHGIAWPSVAAGRVAA